MHQNAPECNIFTYQNTDSKTMKSDFCKVQPSMSSYDSQHNTDKKPMSFKQGQFYGIDSYRE